VVGGVGIGVASDGSLDAGICANEDADQVCFEDVGEGREVGVF
jgi:hypothetical protein